MTFSTLDSSLSTRAANSTPIKYNTNSKRVVDSEHDDDDDDEYDEEGKENVACQEEKNLDFVNKNSSNNKIKLNHMVYN